MTVVKFDSLTDRSRSVKMFTPPRNAGRDVNTQVNAVRYPADYLLFKANMKADAQKGKSNLQSRRSTFVTKSSYSSHLQFTPELHTRSHRKVR